MDEQTVHEQARSIHIAGDADLVLFLIHGYTGSSTDFNGLPALFNERFRASVFVPRLIGHGTRVEDLYGLTHQDFINQIDTLFAPLVSSAKRIIVGGHSFGGLLALYLAARYPVSGVFTTGAPYRLAFPFNIPLFSSIASIKKTWDKRLSEAELEERKDTFYYKQMPSSAPRIVRAINKLLTPLLPQITCPLLNIHSTSDHVSNPKSGELIARRASSRVKRSIVLRHSRHGIFYSTDKETMPAVIADFFENSHTI